MNQFFENKRNRVLLIAGGCVIAAALIGLCLFLALRKSPKPETPTLKTSSAQAVSAPDIVVNSETSSVTSGLVLDVGGTESEKTASVASQAPAKVPTTPTGQAGVVPTALRVKVSSMSLTVGGSASVTPLFTPSTAENNAVTYQSSNAGVATVSAGGKVTGKKAGKAVVTVTSKANPNLKAAVTVTVKEKNNGGQTAASSKPSNNQNTEPAYKCGFPNHLCKSEGQHNYTVRCEQEGCSFCGSHTCKSIYTQVLTDCPKYSEKKDPTIYCQVCGKKKGDGYNGTCEWFLQACNCPDCGKWVEALTCHSH